MLGTLLKPNQHNAFAWTNILILLLLLCIGAIEPYSVLFGYFLETIIIGVFNIVKMYTSSKHNPSKKPITFLIPFFIFHYGMFVGVQSIFLFVLMQFGDVINIKEPFDLITNYHQVLELKGMQYVLGLLFITQFGKFYFDFIKPQKHHNFTPEEIMFKPYVRIIIQQLVVILAMFFILFSNADVVAAVLLTLLRALVDFFLIAIRDNEVLLNVIVDKMYDGKTSKADLKKQLILFSE